jgi:hypothetical protein
MRIFIAVPCPEKVHSEFAQCLAMMSAQLVATGHTVEVGICIGSYLAKNRRELSEFFLNHNFDYLLWLDSDMMIPPDACTRLLSHNVEVAACNYRKRRFPNPIFIACNYKDEFFGPSEEVQVKEDSPETEFIDATGFGCCLIRRDVLERIEKPHFIVHYDEKKNLEIGEDIYFFEKCKRHGIKVLCDNQLSKRISHIGVFHFNWNLSY